MKTYRCETTLPRRAGAGNYVDWIEAQTEEQAKAKWEAERVACGLPDTAVVEIKEVQRRFEWLVGFTEGGNGMMLWDNQEGKAVVTGPAAYAGLRLERPSQGDHPFTYLETWLNSLSNAAL